MYDIWRVVQWWDDWQLRILVLGSLGLQWFVLLAAPMRKFSIPHVYRTCIWLAIISSDALAIYALGTLSNRHARACGNCGATTASSTLELLWAPILLIHLGGQKEIASYEDNNELWMRHTVTLVSQVAVALYAFCKSWHSSSDWKLFAAVVLLFVVGVASLSEKPFALYSAKIKRRVAMSTPSKWNKDKKEGKTKPVALSDEVKVLMLLSDMSLLAAANDLVDRGRADNVHAVLPPLDVAESALPIYLRNLFIVIFKIATVDVTPLYLLYRLLVVPILHMAALTLFATSDKHPYKRTDVKITYIVMCLTAALDVLAMFIGEVLYRLMSMTGVPAVGQTMSGYNLIDTALREGDRGMGWIYKCVARMGSSFCRPQHGDLYGQQTVIIDVVDARDQDLASYRIFDSDDGMERVGSSPNSTTSNWALSKELQGHCGDEIRKSLCTLSFDRIILLWHIATDLCHRCYIDDAALVDDGGGEEEDGVEEQQQQHRRERHLLNVRLHGAVAISDYMAHLLNVNPEMLLTGSRHYLISEAVKEVNKYFLLSKNKNTLSQEDIERILAMEEHKPGVDDSQVFHIKEACKLAKELLELPEDTRWMLMYRVWLGMLCYSASMCRGYLHAKSLGEGGEFLTLVWLLLSLKGAKSLADKLQMPPES